MTQTDSEYVQQLQKNLLQEADILYHFSRSIQSELSTNNTEAGELLMTALNHATNKFLEIGLELNEYGGLALMKKSLSLVSETGIDTSAINYSWIGIGEWTISEGRK